MAKLRYTGTIGAIEYGPVTKTPYRVYPGEIKDDIAQEDVEGLLGRGVFEAVPQAKSKKEKAKPPQSDEDNGGE